jgi:hypothetical protein
MHPNPLLDPLFREYAVARQRQLLCSALRCRAGRRDGVACVGAEPDSGRLGVEPEPAYTPEKLRAA